MTTSQNIDISGKADAPEIAATAKWLNVKRPLSLEDLRGKVVLLHFWAYACVNCIHVLRDLKRLESRYGDELAVIGVHAGKFTNEKDNGSIRHAIVRHDVTHPVVDDSRQAVWRSYGVKAWPTVVLIDPAGKVVGKLSGEGIHDVLDTAIVALLEKFRGGISKEPLPLALEKDGGKSAVLAFPAKVLADDGSNRLFIADTNHNRIIIADLDGKASAVAGTGSPGAADGSFGEAEFDHPRGMALDGDVLYVADTANHLLRRLDLARRTVKTVAGTGRQSRAKEGGAALEVDLNSPWDLATTGRDDRVYIAMAGSHQIWVYHAGSGTIELFAGAGPQGTKEGSLTGAELAQPSGIATDGTDLYFVDSASSSLRMIEIMGGRRLVRTLVGKGLFDFGDEVGGFESARLQNPLGVAHDRGKVYIADSYNHKVKVADPATGRISTLAGTGQAGTGTKQVPQFNEPGGLSIGSGMVYVADTNNNAVRVVSLSTGAVRSLDIDMSRVNEGEEAFLVDPDAERISLEGRAFFAGGQVTITFEFPISHHFSPEARPTVQFRVTGEDGSAWTKPRFVPNVITNTVKFDVELGDIASPRRLEAAVTFYYCHAAGQGACYVGSAVVEGPIETGEGTLVLRHRVGL